MKPKATRATKASPPGQRRKMRRAHYDRAHIRNNIQVLRGVRMQMARMDALASHVPQNEPLRLMSAHVQAEIAATIASLQQIAAQASPDMQEAGRLFAASTRHAEATIEDMRRLRQEQLIEQELVGLIEAELDLEEATHE